MAGRRNHRGFGHIRKLPSGRYQASYIGPDTARHSAPSTFDAKDRAEAWLSSEHRHVSSGEWTPPGLRAASKASERGVTLAEYAESWLKRRDIKPRTRAHYATLIERQILPALGDTALTSLSPRLVAEWHHDLDPERPTLRAHAYGLLRAMCATAVIEREITGNPCGMRGASVSRRKVRIEPATLDQLETIARTMPRRYRALVLLSAWCALRFGEATELRRKDLDLANGLVHVRRAVVRVDGQTVIGSPKSDAGVRAVAIPPHLVPMLRDHLDRMPMRGREALVFPAADGTSHLAPSSLYRVFYRAREVAGRPDLRWHDLRHTGAVLAAQTGATLAELMARLGHSTPQAAMRYQHAARGRDAQIAAALSEIARVHA
jgi:integrase